MLQIWPTSVQQFLRYSLGNSEVVGRDVLRFFGNVSNGPIRQIWGGHFCLEWASKVNDVIQCCKHRNYIQNPAKMGHMLFVFVRHLTCSFKQGRPAGPSGSIWVGHFQFRGLMAQAAAQSMSLRRAHLFRQALYLAKYSISAKCSNVTTGTWCLTVYQLTLISVIGNVRVPA